MVERAVLGSAPRSREEVAAVARRAGKVRAM